ncbi:MAG: hypothetical protein ABJC07_08680 [Acidobacteriota bacterium]
MEGRRLIFVLVAAAGLVLYLWPALRAPVVLWSDSRLDMAWAEQGIGLWSPFPATAREVHPIKPGYLLFLRGAMGAFPWAGKERSAVIVQSFLLWASILGSSLLLARRRGSAAGLMSCAVLFSLLRLRDSASAVMSEPLAAALFLPLGVIALDPPARRRSIPVAALAVVVLFQVRPNVGGMALLLLLAGWSVRKSWRQALLMTILVGGGVVLCWVATRPYAGGESGRATAGVLLFGSAEYYWSPSLGAWPEAEPDGLSTARLRRVASNWSRSLHLPAADRARELRWRALHGLFGLEYYDARWSALYRTLEKIERTVGIPLVLAAIACSLAAGRRDGVILACAGSLLLYVVLQDLLFGSSPRLILPFLPVLLVMGVVALFAKRGGPGWECVATFCVLVLFLAAAPECASWDWGQIEKTGVTLEQRIAPRSLPQTSPATLHVRIAPTAGSARWTLSAEGQVLYRSADEPDHPRPLLTVPLPPELLRRNATESILLRLTSSGEYSSTSYLLFPVIPRPWRSGASRLLDTRLSPATDVDAGGLDWWAHSGDR